MVIQHVENNNFNNTNQQITNNYLNEKFNNNDNAFNNKNLLNKDVDDLNSISSIENINLVNNDFENDEINITKNKIDNNVKENKKRRRFTYQKASTSTNCNNKTLRETASLSPLINDKIKFLKKNKKRRYVKQVNEEEEEEEEEEEDSFVNGLMNNIDEDVIDLDELEENELEENEIDENEYDNDDDYEEIQSRCSSSETTFTKHNISSDYDSTDLPIEVDANGVLIEKRHKCDICDKSFPYLSILESHKRCHTGEKPFSCHFCDKKFAQKATLQVHERTHTGERPYKCKYCDKTFAQYGTKTVHEKSAHLGIRNYKCPKCSKCLSSPSALYTHKKTHGDKSFQCVFCPKQFTLKNYLKLHVKQVHEHGERKHICKFCSKTFAYAGSLQVHVRTHTGERPYICKFCPKAFASQGNLQSHERTHTGERPYTCRHCGRSFIQKSQLTAHEATHALGGCSELSVTSLNQSDQNSNTTEYSQLEQNNNELEQQNKNLSVNDEEQLDYFLNSKQNQSYNVDLINSDSPSSLALLSATAIATSDELANNKESNSSNSNNENVSNKQSEFVCKFCGKRYAYASSLYVHTRLHTGERPFRCNFCDKSFTNQGNMQVHLRVHTGEKPYKCDACSKSYAQKVGLKIHQEQCQMYLNRRGSVNTITSNDSESSLSSVIDGNDCDFLTNNSHLIDQTFEENKKHQETNSDSKTLNNSFSTPISMYFKSNTDDLTTQLTDTTIQQLTQLPTTNISNDILIKNNNDLSNVLAITQLLENQQRIYSFDSQKKLNEITNISNTKTSINNPIIQNTLSSDKQQQDLLLSTSTNSALLLQSVLEQQNQEKQFCQSLSTSTSALSLQQSISLNSTLNPIFQEGVSLDNLSQQTLANLLLQQLEQTTQQQKQQEEQLQKITALKTLIDLQSISNLPQLLPSFNTYLQPQQQFTETSSSLLPQTQQLLYNQQSNISQQQQQQQQQILNSQFLQQHLLTQLLQIQQLEQQQQQQNTLTNNLQVLPSITTQYDHFKNNTISNTTAVDSAQTIVSTYANNSAAQFNLVAATEALQNLSKQQQQQHSQLSLLQ